MYIRIQLPSNARMMPSKNFKISKISDDYEENFRRNNRNYRFKNLNEELSFAKLFRSDNFGGIIRNNHYVIPKCSFLFQFAF